MEGRKVYQRYHVFCVQVEKHGGREWKEGEKNRKRGRDEWKERERRRNGGVVVGGFT